MTVEEKTAKIASQCKPCNRSDILKIECEFVEDIFYNRGEVVRIWCDCPMCDRLIDIRMNHTMDYKDDFRTEFEPEKDSVAMWNRWRAEDISHLNVRQRLDVEFSYNLITQECLDDFWEVFSTLTPLNKLKTPCVFTDNAFIFIGYMHGEDVISIEYYHKEEKPWIVRWGEWDEGKEECTDDEILEVVNGIN